eukprot:CAMPEP_0171121536 /NCGR_PEP_ID=MMETSP0766_2-20121228/102746_1 /TAXON_ID=439317 /ORGANISM="Gambierdiscus australes, Strain CAWD 149" /LENGTH=673 /DNA_ID=CAMNT_0011584321 /DNA_START=9 /DNA_END=2027 /DNA_ORIENTATION=+
MRLRNEPVVGAALRSPSPRTPSAMVQEGPEVARRAAEWERQIESLDQKEMEIHQTQLRLIREQTATFRGDLLALRQEMLELKANNEERAAAHGRLERRCGELSEGFSRHSQLQQEGDRRHAQYKQGLEKLAQELEMARSRLEQLQSTVAEHHSQFSNHHSIAERISYIEKAIGDSADKHGQALREAQLKLDQLHGRIAVFESNHGELKRAHSQLMGDRAELDAKHATVSERVAYLEKLLGDSAEKHSKELESLKSMHSRHVNDTKSTHSSLQALVQQEKDHREQHHASIQARLNLLESALGESADRQAKELETLKGSHNRMFGGHATVAERLSCVERQLGDSADKQKQELSSAHSRIEQMIGRLTSMEMHGSAIESLKKSHASLAQQKADMDVHHATMKERIDYLERAIGDSADKHNRELEELKAGHRMLASEHKVRDKGHSDLKDRIEQFVKAHEKLHAHHATIEDRVNLLEGLIGDSADKHALELAALKATANKHASDLKARESHHATLEERMRYIEKVLGDSADKHDQELRAAHAKLEQLHGRFQEERKARDQHFSATREHLATEQGKREAHQSSVEERVAYLERSIGDSADKHARAAQELESLKGNHARHIEQTKSYQTRHASLEERLEYIEQWFRGFNHHDGKRLSLTLGRGQCGGEHPATNGVACTR